jgi:ATP-dependent Clp protease ATP-binding subunit ClpC
VQVNTEHMLLGLIEEDTLSRNGYLNSGLTLDGVRGVLKTLTGGRKKPVPSTETIVFSREVRRTFEAATNVSCWSQAGMTNACFAQCLKCHS